MPKRKKHTPEQVVAILRRIESGEATPASVRCGLASGSSVASLSTSLLSAKVLVCELR